MIDLPVKQLTFRAAMVAKLKLIRKHRKSLTKMAKFLRCARRTVVRMNADANYLAPRAKMAARIDEEYAIAYEKLIVKRRRVKVPAPEERPALQEQLASELAN